LLYTFDAKIFDKQDKVSNKSNHYWIIDHKYGKKNPNNRDIKDWHVFSFSLRICVRFCCGGIPHSPIVKHASLLLLTPGFLLSLLSKQIVRTHLNPTYKSKSI